MPAKGRRAAGAAAKQPNLMLVVAGAVVLVAVGAWAVSALGGDGHAEAGALPFPDVHGLAVDRDAPDALYVATHHGLFRGADGGAWARVGDTRDDLMGFAAHPTDADTFWSSGHPADPTPGNANLGVRKSTDGGRTWQPLGLADVDFHAMTVSPAQPDRMWGIHRGALFRTDDAGATWPVVAQPAPRAYALAAHPADADTLLAATPDGILRSTDAGATWTPHGAVAAYGLAYDPRDADVVFAAADDEAYRSDDGGATWRLLPLAPEGALLAHVAVSPHDGDVVYMATGRAALYKTVDGGATWSRVTAG